VLVEQVTGTDAASLVGRTSAELGIAEPLVARWELLLGQVSRTGREQLLELTVPTSAGERVFDIRIVPEAGPDDSIQSVLTMWRDVTEQRCAETDRLALYQQLVAQQAQVQELMMGRLTLERERTLERTASGSARVDNLTEREVRILKLLAAGWTNRQIGAEIGLSVGTVKNQIARILSKLNVTDRTQAAVRAVVLGLIAGSAPIDRIG